MNNIEILKFLAKHFNTLIFDTETTGIDPKTNQIIDLGVLRLKEDGSTEEVFNHLIKIGNDEKLSEEITNITGITQEMLDNEGISRVKARKDFSALFYNAKPTLLMAYNTQFDAQFINRFVIVDKNKPLNVNWIDIMAFYKEEAKYPHKLCNAIETYGLQDEVQNSHRAMDDTYACFMVFKKIIENRDIEDVLEHINLFGFNANYGLPDTILNSVNNNSKNNILYVPQSQKGHNRINDTGVIDLTYDPNETDYKVVPFGNLKAKYFSTKEEAVAFIEEQNSLIGPLYKEIINVDTDKVVYNFLKENGGIN